MGRSNPTINEQNDLLKAMKKHYPNGCYLEDACKLMGWGKVMTRNRLWDLRSHDLVESVQLESRIIWKPK